MTGSLTGSMATRLNCKQSCECRMLTLVSKFADGYLSGQRRSPLSILHMRLPHGSPLGVCFTSTKFELNRLRRSLPSPPNPLVGFHHHACMSHANSLAVRSTRHFQLYASTSFLVTIFVVLYCPDLGMAMLIGTSSDNAYLCGNIGS